MLKHYLPIKTTRRFILIFIQLILLILIFKFTKILLYLKNISPGEILSYKHNESIHFITATYNECGGLGNQMFRFAALYGLGKEINRYPYFDYRKKCQVEYMEEIKEIFPLFYTSVSMDFPSNEEIYFAKKFGLPDFKYDNSIKSLGKINKKYLQLGSKFLQSYKYFHSGYRNDIKKFFTCGNNLMKRVNEVAKKIFKNDTSFKFCTHIRRGDFIKFIMQESTKEFTIPSLEFALNYLKEKGKNNLSLIFIGNDPNFVNELNIKNLNVTNIYKFDSLSRGEDMCLAINYCDSILLTASGSTFGWWMAYLMNDNATVFYNSHTSTTKKHLKDQYDYDWFLKEWISISINKNGQAYRETKWWYEKKKNKKAKN